MESSILSKDVSVLVIDDEEPIRRTMHRILTPFVTVYTADGPEKALEVLSSEQIDLCLIDQNLSAEMDGIELATRIKSLDTHLKIIMITGESDSQVVIDALNSGAIDSFISKPFDFMEVKNYMEQNLDQRKRKSEQIRAIIEKIRQGEKIVEDEIRMIAGDMGHLESLMFEFRTTSDESDIHDYVDVLGLVIFDMQEIVYKRILTKDFKINDEFMFRGLVLTLSNLSDELFHIREEGKILDEIKLPNVHAKVRKMEEFTAVVFLSGVTDIPPSINDEVSTFFNKINLTIGDSYISTKSDLMDLELAQFCHQIESLQSET